MKTAGVSGGPIKQALIQAPFLMGRQTDRIPSPLSWLASTKPIDEVLHDQSSLS
jgi:hypothetical protein